MSDNGYPTPIQHAAAVGQVLAIDGRAVDSDAGPRGEHRSATDGSMTSAEFWAGKRDAEQQLEADKRKVLADFRAKRTREFVAAAMKRHRERLFGQINPEPEFRRSRNSVAGGPE